MTILEKLIVAWKAEDYEATVACFVPDSSAVFTDYAPAMIGQDPVYLYGDRTVEMYFRNVFYPMNRTFFIAQERILSDREANFFACYHGRYVFARITVEETDGNGQIRKAIVRPE